MSSQMITGLSKRSPLTSRGVCKAFIIFFLEKLYRYVQVLPTPVHFPLSDDTTQVLLNETKDEFCNSPSLKMKAESLFCTTGNAFDAFNISTYWTTPAQFKTWWKNNIERKTRLNTTKREIESAQKSLLRGPRVNFKIMSVYLAENIKAYFHRQIVRNTCIVIPYELPSHLLLSEDSTQYSVCRKKTKIYGKFNRPHSLSEQLIEMQEELMIGDIKEESNRFILPENEIDVCFSPIDRLYCDDATLTPRHEGSILCVYTQSKKSSDEAP